MRIANLLIEPNDDVYPPDADTFALTTALDKWFQQQDTTTTSLHVLEVGCGSGFLSIYLAKKYPRHVYFSTDLNWQACQSTLKNALANEVSLLIICQDLLKGFLPSTNWKGFDLIFFNPPYLPSDDENDTNLLDMATTGGLDGIQAMKKFIRETRQYLAIDGTVLLLTTHWNPIEKILAFSKQYYEKVEIFYQKRTLSEKYRILLLQNPKKSNFLR